VRSGTQGTASLPLVGAEGPPGFWLVISWPFFFRAKLCFIAHAGNLHPVLGKMMEGQEGCGIVRNGSHPCGKDTKYWSKKEFDRMRVLNG
jgi:hypothetical protein